MSDNPSVAVINKALGAPPGSTLCQPHAARGHFSPPSHEAANRSTHTGLAGSDPEARSLVAWLASMLRASQTALLAQASPVDGGGGGRPNGLKEVVSQAHLPPSRSLGLRALSLWRLDSTASYWTWDGRTHGHLRMHSPARVLHSTSGLDSRTPRRVSLRVPRGSGHRAPSDKLDAGRGSGLASQRRL